MESGRFGGSARRRRFAGSVRRRGAIGSTVGAGRRFRPSAQVCQRGAAGIARPAHAVGSGRWFGRTVQSGRGCMAGTGRRFRTPERVCQVRPSARGGRGCMAGTGGRFEARVRAIGSACRFRPSAQVYRVRPSAQVCRFGAVDSVRPKTTKADCSNSRPSVTASP